MYNVETMKLKHGSSVLFTTLNNNHERARLGREKRRVAKRQCFVLNNEYAEQ